MKTIKIKLVARVTLLAIAAGCSSKGSSGSSDGKSDPSTTVTTACASTPAAVKASLCGTVTNANNSSPIVGAKVTYGASSATTNADGAYVLADVTPGAAATMRVTAKGYGPRPEVPTVTADQISTVDVQLYPVGGSYTGSAANTMTVNAAKSPAGVELAANSLVRKDGTPIAGDVTVTVTPITPANNTNAMPGEYRVDVGSGNTGLMESWGALNVDMIDSADARLDLAQGKTASVRIEVSTRSADTPATIPLFYFNEDTGLWVQEGEATLITDATGTYYSGTVSHFSNWNCDQIYDTVYLNGCVSNADGTPAAGARVKSDGINYSGSSSTTTGADGKFRLPVKQGGAATIAGWLGGQSTTLNDFLSVGGQDGSIKTDVPTGSDIPMSKCLTMSVDPHVISVSLTWGKKSYSFDPQGNLPGFNSYLLYPSGSYGEDNAFLDDNWDDLVTTAESFVVSPEFGPQVNLVYRAQVGTYTYVLNTNDTATRNPMTDSLPRVEVSQGGKVTVLTPPAGEVPPGSPGATPTWIIFNMTVDSHCNATITPVGTWSTMTRDDVRHYYPWTTPQYCTP